MGGGLMQLVAYGAQDCYLNDNHISSIIDDIVNSNNIELVDDYDDLDIYVPPIIQNFIFEDDDDDDDDDDYDDDDDDYDDDDDDEDDDDY